jgi:hypothetical protein
MPNLQNIPNEFECPYCKNKYNAISINYHTSDCYKYLIISKLNIIIDKLDQFNKKNLKK